MHENKFCVSFSLWKLISNLKPSHQQLKTIKKKGVSMNQTYISVGEANL